nr:hypothetical protein [Tanacetum cinerariifolium]GEW49334.1 hypothetical protein [Tanacetum cinerariifolium]
MPTHRTTQRDKEGNEVKLWLNLNLLEERREITAIREARCKQQLEKYYNKRVYHKLFKIGSSSLEIMRYPRWRAHERWDPSGKDHTRSSNHTKHKPTNSATWIRRKYQELGILVTSGSIILIIEQIVKVNQKARILELKRRNHEEHCSDNQYAVSIKEDTTKLFKTTSLDYSSSPEFYLFSYLEDQCEEEVTEATREPTMEEYMTKIREDYGSGIVRHKIDENAHFELKCQFLKELRDNTFSGSDNDDANEHIEKVFEIVDLFHIPEVTQDQIMLRVIPMSHTGASSRWLRNEPASSIDTWETLKKKFLSKCYPPARTAKKMEEINKFQQEPDETLYQRFKELLLRCPQHYLTNMQEVILFYKELDTY